MHTPSLREKIGKNQPLNARFANNRRRARRRALPSILTALKPHEHHTLCMPQPELAVQDEALEVSAELMSPAVTEAASPDDQGDADKHAPLNPAWIMKAKSTKRKLTSAVWDHYQQLTDECPMKTKGFTHVCTLPLGDDVSCNMVRGCAGFPRYSV